MNQSAESVPTGTSCIKHCTAKALTPEQKALGIAMDTMSHVMNSSRFPDLPVVREVNNAYIRVIDIINRGETAIGSE